MQLDLQGPVIHGAAREAFGGVPAAGVTLASNRHLYGPIDETAGLVLLPLVPNLEGRRFLGVPDDNRSVILPDVVSTVEGRGYAVSVKGVGARAPLYGQSPIDFAFESDFGGARDAIRPGALAGSRALSGEAWFGESPYGAQGEVPAAYALGITELAEGCSISGFYICPVFAVSEIPGEFTEAPRDRYWYRRYGGRFLQEQRLVPSNIRLYHQSELTLGQAPAAVLHLFGVRAPEGVDAFIDRYIASGVAALTTFARTMRPSAHGFQGLDYSDVWLDKDSLVAPDGTLHFADLEGMEWVLAGQDVSLEARVRDEFDRNFYEFMYGLHVLVRERERMAGRSPSQAERRASLIPRFEVALANDAFVRCEASGKGLDLAVLPPLGDVDEVVIRAIDQEADR